MLDSVHMRDRLLGLCNLMVQQSLDGAAARASELILEHYNGLRSVVLLLDTSGTELVVAGGTALGDVHWGPKPAQISIASASGPRDSDQCPFQYVAMSGLRIDLDLSGNGFELGQLLALFEAPQTLKYFSIIPLKTRDSNLLATGVIASDTRLNTRDADAVSQLIERGIAAQLDLTRQLYTQQQTQAALHSSLAHARESDKIRKKQIDTDMRRALPGQSNVMIEFRKRLGNIAGRNVDCLIQGPRGANPEGVAHTLHRFSHAHEHPFTYLSGSSLSSDTYAQELFGYRRGAIRGVSAARRGLLTSTGKGTLYVENAESMSAEAQRALLRVMEQREFKQVGSDLPKKFEGRLVMSSSEPLAEVAAEGRFEPSLFFRLRVNALEIPKLDDCLEDIEDICQRVLADLHQSTLSGLSISPEAIEWLREQSFPGDRAELRELIRLAAQNSDTLSLQKRDLEAARYQHILQMGSKPQRSKSLPAAMRAFEAALIQQALTKSGQSRTKAAQLLCIPKRTLAEKCKRLKI